MRRSLLFLFTAAVVFGNCKAATAQAEGSNGNSSVSSVSASSVASASAHELPGWGKFSPQSGEFTILLPSPVAHSTKDAGGTPIDTYTAKNGAVSYMVEGGYNLQDSNTYDNFADGVEKGALSSARQQMPSVQFDVQRKDAEGSGWHGRELTFRADGKPRSTMVIAMSSAVPVAVVVVGAAPPSDSRMRAIIESLNIDSEKSLMAHPVKQRASENFKLGYQVGRGLIWVFAVGALAILGLSVMRKARSSS